MTMRPLRIPLKQRVPACLILSVLLAAACAPRKTTKAPEQTRTSAAAAAPAAPQTPPTETGEVNLRGTEFVTAPDLETVHFDYDSYALSDAVRETLKKNAAYLTAHADLDVLVTGNCDERGTIAYNLALGQKRAQAVRDYYIRTGVSAQHMATISYGKEKPLCAESNEGCWSKNRRAETLVRTRAEQKSQGAQ